MSASCAFMLPVATAPNAVVFGTGQIGIQTMVRWGIWVNVLGVVVISAVVFGVTAAR
jgi:sodium-dependent dicarboxylate transporter 2/3/5